MSLINHLFTATLSGYFIYQTARTPLPNIASPIGLAAHRVTLFAAPLVCYTAAAFLAHQIPPLSSHRTTVAAEKLPLQFAIGLIFHLALFALLGKARGLLQSNGSTMMV